MSHPILYCGDTDQAGAAAYLSGLMTHAGWSFDYIPSHQPLTATQFQQYRSLVILSDYPAAQCSAEIQTLLIEQIATGCGLLMIGGWESFHGLGGDWDQTPVGKLLGVKISAIDDRCNSFNPAMLVPSEAGRRHPILKGLPWDAHPPFVGGWNRVQAGAATPLISIQQFDHYQVASDGALSAKPTREDPGLMIHEYVKGRVTTFMPDVAPHWVGGFVDWGDSRVTAQSPGASAIEVGNWYAQFWKQLLQWTGQLPAPAV